MFSQFILFSYLIPSKYRIIIYWLIFSYMSWSLWRFTILSYLPGCTRGFYGIGINLNSCYSFGHSLSYLYTRGISNYKIVHIIIISSPWTSSCSYKPILIKSIKCRISRNIIVIYSYKELEIIGRLLNISSNFFRIYILISCSYIYKNRLFWRIITHISKERSFN